VPKGQVAKKEDWQKAFGTDDINKVIEEVRRGLKTNPQRRRA
jgi:ribosome maturation protein SDO1